jgi:hypothetical protein
MVDLESNKGTAKMKKIFLAKIYKDIENYFGYLFERGFTIRELDCVYENSGHWKIILESEKCTINIYSDRDEIFISLSPTHNREYEIGIEPMVYFLSEGNTFIGWFEGNQFKEKKKQFERLANLLEIYGDQIIPYFGEDFEKYKDALIQAQREYNDLFLKKYSEKHPNI